MKKLKLPEGPLTTPLKRSDCPNEEAYRAVFQSRLEMLCGILGVEWHGFEKTEWQEVALRLAQATVPGMSFTDRGRPSKNRGFGWMREFEQRWQLLDAAQSMLDRGETLSAAAKYLAKNPKRLPRHYQTAGSRGGALGAEALRKKLAKAIEERKHYYTSQKALEELFSSSPEHVYHSDGRVDVYDENGKLTKQYGPDEYPGRQDQVQK